MEVKRRPTSCKAAAAAVAKSLQSCPTLCDPIDGGAWQGTVHRVAQSQTRLKRQHPGMHKQKRTEKWHSKTDNSQTSKNLVRPFSKLAAAAAVAKSLQSCPTLCDPIDGSPPSSLVPGILQSRTLEWVAIAFSNA